MGAGRRRGVRAFALTALAVATAGCWWAQPGYNAHRTGFHPHEHAIDSANAATLEVEHTVPGLLAVEIIRSRSGYVHVLGDGITTVDPSTGAVVWSTPVDLDHQGVPTVIAIGGILYVPRYDPDVAPHGCLARFDALDGDELGCLPFDGPDPTTLQWGTYIEAVASGPWIAITTSSVHESGRQGSTLSVVHTTEPGRSWNRSFPESTPGIEISNPIIVDGMVLAVVTVLGQDSQLQRWPLDCTVPDCAPVDTTQLSTWLGYRIGASAGGDQLAVVGLDLLEVLDLDTLTPLWSADLGTGNVPFPSARPTWTPGSLVVATVSGGTGPSRVWRFPADGCGASSCDPGWTVDVPGFPGGQIAAAEDILFLSSSSDPLLVLPEDCSDPCVPLFDLPGEAFWGAPLLDGGRIWVTRTVVSDTGRHNELVALRPAG